ncbi:hypothetical protein Tco_1335558 [Tanacetum coccineum]
MMQSMSMLVKTQDRKVAKTLKTNKDKDLKILEQKTMTKAQDQISQSMYNKIKTKTKTQELNDKAISISPWKVIHGTDGVSEYPESNEEMKPNIENMTLEEYLRYESEKESQVWKCVRSKRRTTRYKKGYVDSFYDNKNEEFDEDEYYRLPPLKPCFQTPQLCTRFNSMPHNSNEEVYIDNMSLEEYELYMAMQCLKMNEVQDPTHSVTSQFFDHSTHTPDHPLDKKDIILEEILDDLFSMRGENLKRMEQKEDQLLTPTVHALPKLELVVQPYVAQIQFPNEVMVFDVMQTFTSQTIYTIPLDDAYVVPGTEPMLDELLEEFRDELLDINVVDE